MWKREQSLQNKIASGRVEKSACKKAEKKSDWSELNKDLEEDLRRLKNKIGEINKMKKDDGKIKQVRKWNYKI